MSHNYGAVNASVLGRKRRVAPQAASTPEGEKDFGFGARVLQESQTRLLNRDGSFNTRRHGIPWIRSWSLFHWLLTIPWRRFYLVILIFYTTVNLLFAGIYFSLGPSALAGARTSSEAERFMENFFFSVQTLTTVGYGRMSPEGLWANTIVSINLLVGLLSFAVITGLLFARFSQPAARVRFSTVGLIAPFKEGYAFMFRVVNERSSQMIDVRAVAAFARAEQDPAGKLTRKFYVLPLDREKVTFFPLHWTVVHPITESSPLAHLTEEEFRDSNGEFIVAISGIDEATGQMIQARSSYGPDEVVFYARFADLLGRDREGHVSVDLRKLDGYEAVGHDPVASVTA